MCYKIKTENLYNIKNLFVRFFILKKYDTMPKVEGEKKGC